MTVYCSRTIEPEIDVYEAYPGFWYAHEGDYDLDILQGSGHTPLEAIVDLLDQLEERI